jgi:hypothetical protein
VIFCAVTPCVWLGNVELVFDENVGSAAEADNLAQNEIKVANKTNKLRGLSPRANYTDRAAAAGRQS